MTTVDNIVLYQGADFYRNITLTDQNNNPLNVQGYSANGGMKIDTYANDPKSTTANVFVFQTQLSNGNLQIFMYANATINIPQGYYNYDVMIWNGTATYRVMEGIAQVDPAISLTNVGT